MKMIILVFLLLMLPELYIWWHFLRDSHWAVQAVVFVPWLAVVTLMTLMRTSMVQDWMFRWAMIVMLCCIMPMVLFMLLSCLGWALKFFMPGAWRVMNGIGIVMAVAVVCIVGYGIGIGWKKLVVTEVELSFKDLPAGFDGYRIVQLSDFHIGTYQPAPECVTRIVEQVNALNADMVCFTGDLVNSTPEELNPFMADLRKMKAKDGIFSIMGNHDYCMYRQYAKPSDRLATIKDLQQRQRSFGWDLLLNEHRIIRHNGDSLMLIGVENSSKPPFPDYGDLKKAMACKGIEAPAASNGNGSKAGEVPATSNDNGSKAGKVPATSNGNNSNTGKAPANQQVSAPAFSILLSHDPTHWQRKVLPETGIQLQLSGHTHSTQFRIFGWSPAAFTYKEYAGLYEMLPDGRELFNPETSTPAARKLYVSTGTGGNVSFRFGVWPEIVVITLRKG